MFIIAFLINFSFSLGLFGLFWFLLPAYFSDDTVKWIMYISFGLGGLLTLGGFGLLKGGESDGRFKTGHKGNVTPDLPGGCFILHIAINLIILGWGYVFFDKYSSISEVLRYIDHTAWGKLNLFVYITPFIFLLNGFLVPIAGIFLPED